MTAPVKLGVVFVDGETGIRPQKYKHILTEYKRFLDLVSISSTFHMRNLRRCLGTKNYKAET